MRVIAVGHRNELGGPEVYQGPVNRPPIPLSRVDTPVDDGLTTRDCCESVNAEELRCHGRMMTLPSARRLATSDRASTTLSRV